MAAPVGFAWFEMEQVGKVTVVRFTCHSILDEKAVIGRAQAAVVDARAEDRLIDNADQEIIEAIEIDLAAAVLVCRDVELVVDDFDARADAVLTARDRENISNRS